MKAVAEMVGVVLYLFLMLGIINLDMKFNLGIVSVCALIGILLVPVIYLHLIKEELHRDDP